MKVDPSARMSRFGHYDDPIRDFAEEVSEIEEEVGRTYHDNTTPQERDRILARITAAMAYGAGSAVDRGRAQRAHRDFFIREQQRPALVIGQHVVVDGVACAVVPLEPTPRMNGAGDLAISESDMRRCLKDGRGLPIASAYRAMIAEVKKESDEGRLPAERSLINALTRLAEATERSTNSASAKEAFSWVRAVAETALADHPAAVEKPRD